MQTSLANCSRTQNSLANYICMQSGCVSVALLAQAFWVWPCCLIASVAMSALDWLNATECPSNATVVKWYCQTDETWEAYPAHICELLEREHQHVEQGTSVAGGVVHWKFSSKTEYEIDVSNMHQKNIKTGKIRGGPQRTAPPVPEPPRSLDASNHTCMIARQIDRHDSVMIRASRSKRSKIKWWLPSGSHVLAAMQSIRYHRICTDFSCTKHDTLL